MYNDKLRQARIDYTEAALVEMNAICNVIENDDMEKCELLQQRAQEFGEMAQEKYFQFVAIASELYPDNPALGQLNFDAADADEN